jgi:RNA polymerase sigma factor (sigma-70 family)
MTSDQGGIEVEARKDTSARVAAMVIQHHDTLLRIARQVSLCPDDAHDAVQRGLEIYLRRLDTVEEATELAWLKVVVRNEALAVRKARSTVAVVSPDLDTRPSPERDPHEHAASAERITRSAEALQRLKRDEARALIAKSMGLSYDEIGRRFGWSYTKVNRNLVKGRTRFFQAFRDIEEGVECQRLAPALLDLAEGVTDSEEVIALRPHLRSCQSCRATVRHLHGSRWRRTAAAVALPGKWLLDRFAQAKAEAYGAATRALELVAAAPLGGGRGAAATALVGLCLGGATCVEVFGDPPPEERRDARASVQRAAPRERVPAPASRRPATVAVPRAPRRAPSRIHARATPTPAPARPARTEFAPLPPPAEFTPAPAPREFTPTPAPVEFTASASRASGEFGGG